ncbi:MAG: lipoprotein insertase outer membrane protein LolB [Methylotenera sp.]
MYLIRILTLATFKALLSSCVSAPIVKPAATAASQASHQHHLQSLTAIQKFTLNGRIGVQTEGKGFSGGLNWQHNNANDDITLRSPLGGQVASIKKTSDQVTLEDAKGNIISASNAETLTQNALGWKLPLAGLADWSLGRPTNSTIQASTWDEQGKLSTLKQDGWDIEYQNYAENNGIFLPNKILLKSEKVNLKLLVENWDINSQ